MKASHDLFRLGMFHAQGASESYPFYSLDKEGNEHLENDVEMYSSTFKSKYLIMKLHPEDKWKVAEFNKKYQKGMDVAMQYGKPWLKRWGLYLRNMRGEAIEFANLEEAMEFVRTINPSKIRSYGLTSSSGYNSGGKNSNSCLWIIVSIVVVIGIFGVIGAAANSQNTNNTASNNIVGSSSIDNTTSSSWQSYSYSSDGYAISFPAQPTRDASSINARGYTVNYVQYTSQPSNDVAYLSQYAYFTNGYQPADDNATLTSVMQSTLATYSSSSLVSSQFITFHGLNAIEFTAQVVKNGYRYNMEALDVIKSGKMYSLSATAVSGSSYDFFSFINSFSFI